MGDTSFPREDEQGVVAYMSIDTDVFVNTMAIMCEIGKALQMPDGEKIRAVIESGAKKTIIKVTKCE